MTCFSWLFVVVVVVFLAYKFGQNHLAEQQCFLVLLWLEDPHQGGHGGAPFPLNVVKCGRRLDVGRAFLRLEAQPTRHPVACNPVRVRWGWPWACGLTLPHGHRRRKLPPGRQGPCPLQVEPDSCLRPLPKGPLSVP